MKPTILPTLYACIYHLSKDTRNINTLENIANESGQFAVEGNDEHIHISLFRNACISEDTALPLDLRQLIEFTVSHDIYDIYLGPDENMLPCLTVYEDDYVFTFTIYAKIKISTRDMQVQTHTCKMELEPRIMPDHRIFESFRDTAVKYARIKLGSIDTCVTFISKDEYDEINLRENCESTLHVAFDDNGYTVNEQREE